MDIDFEKKINRYLADHGCRFEVCKGYGMTELAATAVSSFVGANAVGSVGIPLISNTMKIMDLDSGREQGYNRTGEIWISGPSVMLGYYQKPSETAEMIVTDKSGVRWIRTGDLGHITEDGLLFHEGRIRRIYLTVHEGQPAKIFPMVVEEALRKSRSVRECSVVGRKRGGSDYCEAVAFVVRDHSDLDDASVVKELKAVCAENVPAYMIPAEYRFLDELPHTPVGKVDFRTLERMAAGETE